jgi:hypothetical protein
MSTSRLSTEVTEFLDALNHPFRAEIELLRQCVLSAHGDLTENIKWNGPSYCHLDNDRITMRIQPLRQQAQLIFHRGAKVLSQPADRLLQQDFGLLQWKENDRAVATFKSMLEIEQKKEKLTDLVTAWLEATA